MKLPDTGEIREYLVRHKRDRTMRKWSWLLRRSIVGRFLFGRITAPERMERFAHFYLEGKRADWELVPEHVAGSVLDVACDIPIDGLSIGRLPSVRRMVVVDVKRPVGLPLEKVLFVRADATTLPFSDNSFDLVTSFSSIEHLVDRDGQARWIREMTRVVKPGGAVAVTVDNAFSILNGFPFFLVLPNKQMLPVSWALLRKMILSSGRVQIEKRYSSRLYQFTSWFRPWAESIPSYWLEKLLTPLNGRFPAVDARIGYRYTKTA